ncbi:MAG TPA: bifunctional demethylmenaquinone methyltransferase/2-methoxy-6-polyprenyl-1,4-benzoquinol methylase UbiE [Cytophagales bacterium]|nr:bifunctional demethylmenaquinone methyltransferase/2-methoxy-6-polyprenyl-1,4-benzoquinol methylase UbiE [Cytophagales bacterium]
MSVVPYKEKSTSKRVQVEEMFDHIAPKYDFLNRFLSLGIDIIWRKKLIAKLKKSNPKYILDIATGTADVALATVQKLQPERIVGVDISNLMLEVGRKKIKNRNLSSIIELIQADSENLPFAQNEFDAATVAFGVRNFERLEIGLAEILRVLKPGATLAVLEFSKPKTFPVKQIYQFYFQYILPKVGNWLSKDASAYTYLPESVDKFPYGKDFLLILGKVGFKNSQCHSLTFGIASIYTAQKPS